MAPAVSSTHTASDKVESASGGKGKEKESEGEDSEDEDEGEQEEEEDEENLDEEADQVKKTWSLSTRLERKMVQPVGCAQEL